MLAQRFRLPFRLHLSTSLLVSVVSQMMFWASPAEAQGFFQQLFGLSPAPQSYATPRAVTPRAPVAGTPLPLVYTEPPASRTGRNLPPEGSGSYTTMCVRMCDGFYFPVSHRVPRSRFYRDADICRARCPNSEARLFYHSSSGGNMKDAVDLTGRAYARLPIAFQHRKRLVEGCGCKPEPWSVEATIRHEGYAMAEGRSVPGRSHAGGSLTIVAGSYPETTTNPPAEEPEVAADTSGSDAVPAQVAADPATASEATADASQSQPAARLQARPRKQQPRSLERNPAARTAAARPGAIAPQRKPTRVATAAPAFASGGGSKLVWPGDAPTRMR